MQDIWDLIMGKSRSLIPSLALVCVGQFKFGCREVYPFSVFSSLSLFWCWLVLCLSDSKNGTLNTFFITLYCQKWLAFVFPIEISFLRKIILETANDTNNSETINISRAWHNVRLSAKCGRNSALADEIQNTSITLVGKKMGCFNIF